MTHEEQIQAEAKAMVEQYAFNGRNYAIMNINKLISLRVPPMEYYEQVKQAILNYHE